MNRNLKRETMLYGLGRYSSVLLTLLTTCVLSRLLTPEEYGVVAVTAVFSALFTVVANLGLSTAVIQNKSLTPDDLDDIFSFSVYASVALAVIFMLLGFPIAAVYHDGIYRKICALLSISVFFTAINIVPHGALMRKKRFQLMGMRLICAAVFSGLAAIALAFMGFGCYTLVFQSILNTGFIFVWNIWNARLRFKPRFCMQPIRKIYGYSSNQFAFSLVNFFEGNLDNFLIGKVLGSESLAYYDKGYRLMMYPVQNLTYVISPVIHPILSEYQDDKQYIYNAYMKLVRVLSMLGVFFSISCWFAGEEIILFFFGSQWTRSVPLFRLLALSVWPQMVSASTASIYQSTNNTRLLFRSSLLHAAVLMVMIIAGICMGTMETVALMVMLGLYMRFFIDYYLLVVKNFGYSYRGFLKSFRGELLIAGCMAAAALLIGPYVQLGGMAGLIVKMAVMTAAFAAGLIITGEYRYVTDFFRAKGR